MGVKFITPALEMMSQRTQNQEVSEPMKLHPSQKVVLIAGPAGSGKTSLGKHIGTLPGWTFISEDRIWDEIKHPPHEARSSEVKENTVQPRALDYIKVALQKGDSVVLEFIVYETPPQPIIRYRAELEKLGVPFITKVLRPTAEEILARKAARGDEGSAEHQRFNTELQIRSLSSEFIDPSWVVDSTEESLEDTYRRCFELIVEGPR